MLPRGSYLFFTVKGWNYCNSRCHFLLYYIFNARASISHLLFGKIRYISSLIRYSCYFLQVQLLWVVRHCLEKWHVRDFFLIMVLIRIRWMTQAMLPCTVLQKVVSPLDMLINVLFVNKQVHLLITCGIFHITCLDYYQYSWLHNINLLHLKLDVFYARLLCLIFMAKPICELSIWGVPLQ